MRVNVRSATGSQKSDETPSANIAIARCSSTSKSCQEMPSISHPDLPRAIIEPKKLKIYQNRKAPRDPIEAKWDAGFLAQRHRRLSQ